jgi:hypothetical protein
MYDLLVVGAGPYGLSIASHAAKAGLRMRAFGRPMASWRDHMPTGMFLKSEPWASNLSDPDGRYGLDVYCVRHGLPPTRHGVPIPVETYADYGLWFARAAVPGIDERMILSVRRRPGGYEAVTDDGETLSSRAVVLAVGVMPFAELPYVLRGAPAGRVSHSTGHSDLAPLSGRDVTVVGAGQAALETAALLAEGGTRVRVVARAPQLRWNTVPPARRRPWWRSARAPHSGLGCGWRNWSYAELPWAFRLLPEATRTRTASTALGPAGAWWVRGRVEPGIEVLLGHEVTRARAIEGGLRLELWGPRGPVAPLETEHVIAATGFRPSCDRLGVLAPELRVGLSTLADGSPYVGRDFESSAPGLFLAGLITASTFGPAMRFVQGAGFTADRVVRGVRRYLREQSGAVVSSAATTHVRRISRSAQVLPQAPRADWRGGDLPGARAPRDTSRSHP